MIVAVLGSSPSTAIDVTVLPDPDSPTMPSTSFSKTSNVTPSTAFTTPSSVGNCTRRSRTDSTGSPDAGGEEPSLCRSTKGSTGGRSSVGGLGVEGVAQAVAEEVHGEHGDQEEQAREVDEVGLGRVPTADSDW